MIIILAANDLGQLTLEFFQIFGFGGNAIDLAPHGEDFILKKTFFPDIDAEIHLISALIQISVYLHQKSLSTACIHAAEQAQ